jgi:hypothetical protein
MRTPLTEPLSLTTRALGWAGLLPFLAAAAALAWGPAAWHEPGQRVLVTYGAVIVSFLGGVHWGAPTGAAHDGARLWGVVPSLLAWPMLLLPSTRLALLGLALALALCWAVDRARFPKLGLAALLPLRTLLSGVAIACCLLGAWSV